MAENPPPEEDDLTEEFRNLGKNLVGTLRTAWESPERKRLQSDIENGLSELGSTLQNEVQTFKEGPTGQRLKSNVEDFRQRVRTGEVSIQARQELLEVLKRANAELEKVMERWSSGRKEEP